MNANNQGPHPGGRSLFPKDYRPPSEAAPAMQTTLDWQGTLRISHLDSIPYRNSGDSHPPEALALLGDAPTPWSDRETAPSAHPGAGTGTVGTERDLIAGLRAQVQELTERLTESEQTVAALAKRFVRLASRGCD